MKRLTPAISLPVAVIVTLSGCAGDTGRYPSLAIRDVERASGQFTPTSAETQSPIRPVASAAQLSDLLESARQSQLRFANARGDTERLVRSAQGRSIDSNARQLALVALADLATLRSDTALAIGDLDLLKAEAATTFAPQADIDAARAEISTLLDAQDSALDTLWARLQS
ncbi:hypothetical protein [Erythrobacter sp. MTPC3]|uniref:hypothetical protein n=1 Tax=Erythrobacter sp. MTPC3 TaxID=3056564 RepID=UPI0036F2A371